MRRKYLFIGAHPDDVEINAGGTIADLVQEGHMVSVVVCSYTPHAERGKESLMALKVLGVRPENVHFLGLTEPNLHELLPQLIAGLERVIKYVKPDVVVTHFYGDTHQDHEAVNKATMVAARFVNSLYMYCPTYPSGRTNVAVHPNLIRFFDEAALSKKLEALSEHVSQKVKYGDESWLKSVESIARADAWRYGGKHGCAELFQISRTTIF